MRWLVEQSSKSCSEQSGRFSKWRTGLGDRVMTFWLLFACFIFLAFSSLLGCLESSLFFRLWLRLYRELSVTPQTSIFLCCLCSFLLLLSWSLVSVVVVYFCFCFVPLLFPITLSAARRPSFLRFFAVGGPSLAGPLFASPLISDPWARDRLTAVPLCPCGREFPAR